MFFHCQTSFMRVKELEWRLTLARAISKTDLAGMIVDVVTAVGSEAVKSFMVGSFGSL
jgi:hypothetical protein